MNHEGDPVMKDFADAESLWAENQRLKAERDEALEVIRALRGGEVDAIVVSGPRGEQVYSLSGVESVYRLIVESMQEATLTLTPEGRILWCNLQFATLINQPAGAIVGRPLDAFVPPSAHAALGALLAQARTEPVQQRLIFQAADGSPVPTHVAVQPVHPPDSPSLCLVATDLTRLEASLESLRQLREQDRALQASEERYRLALQATNDALWDCDLAAGTVQWNEQYERAFGRPPETGGSWQWWIDHIHPDDRERTVASLRAAIAGAATTWSDEYRFRRADGVWADIVERAYIARDTGGTAWRVVGTMQDRTVHKQAEAALRESEERFRVLTENLRSGVALIDEGGAFRIVNGAFLRLFDLPPDADILNVNSLDWAQWQVFDERGAPLKVDEHPVRKAALTGTAVKNHLVAVQSPSRPDLKWLLISAEPILDARGGVRRLICTYYDITDRKAGEEALQRATARYALLADTAAALLAAPNPQAVVEDLCARVMAHLECDVFFNFLADEATGKLRRNACAGIPADEAARLEWLECGVTVCGCVARDQVPIVAEDIQGSRDPRTALVKSYGVQAYCCHPLLAGGRLLGTLSFGTRRRPRFAADEVELMRAVADQVAVAMHRLHAEEALRRSQAELERRVCEQTADLRRAVDTLETQAAQLRALSVELTRAEQRERRRLATILHDEHQQLLVAAKLRMDLLGRRQDSEGQAICQEVTALLQEAIEHSRELTRDLNPPLLRSGGLVPALTWLVGSMGEKHKLMVTVEAEDLGVFPTTEEMTALLFQSVRELLFNVAKHAQVSEVRLRLSRTAGAVQIQVTDAGVGFDPTHLRATGGEGGGFGLFSIRHRLALLGGQFDIVSAPGQGSQFTLTVPLDRDAPVAATVAAVHEPAPERAPTERPGAHRKLRVVVADDHALVRQAFARFLAAEPDLEIVGEAADGKVAVELTGQLQPDVVTMDVGMPVLDGIEATRQIRAQWPHVRVIGLSMFANAEQANAMREAGAAAYVTKSAPAEELLAAIRG